MNFKSVVGFTNRLLMPALFLAGITDARGVKVLAATYHNARLVETTDATGESVQTQHDIAGRREEVTDRRGTKTVMFYDDYGNVTKTMRELRTPGGVFVRWITGESAYADVDNPEQFTSVTQYLNGRAIVTSMRYDKDGNVLEVVDPLKRKTLATYAQGRVLTVRDQRAIDKGYTTVTNSYDGRGNLLTSTDALGHATTFTYFPSGVPQTVKDAKGNVTTFALDAKGNLTSVTDARNHVTRFEYDANGNKTRTLTTRTFNGAPQELASQMSYDAEDRPILAVAPDGVKSRTFYNLLGSVDRSIRAFGTPLERTTSYEYDVLGQRIKTIAPDGGVTRIEYDDAGQVEASFDRIGRGSLSEYDSLGRLVRSYQVVPGTGEARTRLVKDPAGQPLYSETTYDDLGRVTASRDTQNRWSYTRYDDAGNALESEDSQGNITKTVYDELNRAYQTIDAKQRTTTTLFDNAGRATQTTFHDGSFTRTVYDELNRAIEVHPQRRADEPARPRTMHYDKLGRMDWIELPLDIASNRVLRTRFGYDELGRKVWQQDAKGARIDAQNGRNIDIDEPVSRVTRFVYDVRGRQTARVLPAVNGQTVAEATEYNELGQVKRSRDFRGYWTRFDYDVRGRLTAKTPDAALGEAAVTMEYPDELTTIARRGALVTTSKSDLNRGWMDQVTMPNGVLTFGHDEFGQTTSQTLKTGTGANASTRTTSFSYDSLGRLSTITGHDSKKWAYGYDELGNKTRLVRPNNTVTTYDYDALNRLETLENWRGNEVQVNVGQAALLSRMSYRLRGDGRRDKLTETLVQPDGSSTQRTVAYAFDDSNRLTKESGDDGAGRQYEKSYLLDEAGNRVSSTSKQEQQDGTIRTSTTQNQFNELDWLLSETTNDGTSERVTSYGYDANGSQTLITSNAGAANASSTKQVWGFEGHLLARGSVDEAGAWNGTRTAYAYDVSGMRLSQSTVNLAGTVTNGISYVWNGDRVAEERDENGKLLAFYEHGQELGPLRLTRPATSTRAEQERFFIGDGQDSTRQLVDEAG